MKAYNCLLALFLGAFLFSCGNGSDEKESDFTLDLTGNKTEYRLGETIEGSLTARDNKTIDSAVYFLQGKRLGDAGQNGSFSHTFDNEKLGRWNLRALVYSDGEEQEIGKEITIYNDAPPVTYTYNINATYPHSSEAYTQGLEFYRDTLFESTGEYGESSLRKVILETGEVVREVKLDKNYFGEGLTILNDKVYQLTWKAGEGFIYDPETLERLGNFAYNESKEGWGLANDGEKLYKSDGTEKIWILDPETLSEEEFIQTVTHRTISTQLNELEWINGRIYANTYQKDGVAIINPENGAIEGLINFSGLRDQLGNKDDLDPVNHVLNGIAYNPNTGKIYVTGKNWDKLFEVEIVER